MIFFLRILSDFFWEIKIINIITNVILFFFVLNIIKVHGAIIHKEARKPLAVLIGLSLVFLLSLFRDINDATLIIFFKVIFSFLMFFYGTIYKNNIFNVFSNIDKLCLFLILLFFAFSFFSFAYVDWGAIKTFKGLYYFKTDMAMSVVICLTFILISKSFDKKIKIIMAIISCYLIFKTNARIHLLSVFLIIGLYLYGERVLVNFKKKLLYIIPITIILFVGAVIVTNSLAGDNNLQIELNSDEAYSGKNLQGRNEIWDSLISGYQEASSLDQFIGMGIDMDVKISMKNSGIGHNAHNGYLFILIAGGAIGFFLFLYFLYLVMSRFFKLIKHYSKLAESEIKQRIYTILYFFLVNTIVFLTASISMTLIIFQQQTWFFMFFAGFIFNPQLLKRITIKNYPTKLD